MQRSFHALIFVLLIALSMLVLAGCPQTAADDADVPQNTQPSSKDDASEESKPDAGDADQDTDASDASADSEGEKADAEALPEGNPLVTFTVAGRGSFMVELYEDETPNTVANFIWLVEQGAYNGDLFHRILPGSVLQGGDKNNAAVHAYSIHNEAIDANYDFEGKSRNLVGTIAMARTIQLHSAGKQFFINLSDNSGTHAYDNPAQPYCVFGKVISGMDVVRSVQLNDVIESIKIDYKRSHEYVPMVKYPGDRIPRKALPLGSEIPPQE